MANINEIKDMINGKVLRDAVAKAEEEYQKDVRRKEIMDYITSVRQRIKDLVEIANYCYSNSINLDHKRYTSTDNYENNCFVANGISHRLGLIEEYKNNVHNYKCLGIKGRTYDSMTLFVDGDTVYWTKEGSSTPIYDGPLGDLEAFRKSFEDLEKYMYAYIEKYCNK